MLSYQPDFTRPPDDEPGWDGFLDSMDRDLFMHDFRETTVLVTPPEPPSFDDTYKLTLARLREHVPFNKQRTNGPQFERGIPTNDQTSATNYTPQMLKQLVDGEHKTLLALGKVNEAFDDDNHPFHVREHRMLLSNPNLSETQRASLLEHLASHEKKHRKQLKQIKEEGGGSVLMNKWPRFNAKASPFKSGFGTMSKAKSPTHMDVIPQDDQQSQERKRTAGMISQESRRSHSGYENRVRRFRAASQRAYGRRSL
jgi:hypothetical protein